MGQGKNISGKIYNRNGVIFLRIGRVNLRYFHSLFLACKGSADYIKVKCCYTLGLLVKMNSGFKYRLFNYVGDAETQQQGSGPLLQRTGIHCKM